MTHKEFAAKDPELVRKVEELYACLLRMVENESHTITHSRAIDREFHKGRRDGVEDVLMHCYRLELDRHLPPWD